MVEGTAALKTALQLTGLAAVNMSFMMIRLWIVTQVLYHTCTVRWFRATLFNVLLFDIL